VIENIGYTFSSGHASNRSLVFIEMLLRQSIKEFGASRDRHFNALQRRKENMTAFRWDSPGVSKRDPEKKKLDMMKNRTFQNAIIFFFYVLQFF